MDLHRGDGWKDLAKSLWSDASSIDLTELVAAERFGIRDTWLSNKSDANLTPGLNRKGYHGVAEGRCIHDTAKRRRF